MLLVTLRQNYCCGTLLKWSESHSVVSNPLGPYGLYSPWNSPGQNTGVGSLSQLQGNLPNPGIKPRSPALQVDSLPAEPQGEPKNTGVGSIFPSLGDLPDPGIQSRSPALQADSLETELGGGGGKLCWWECKSIQPKADLDKMYQVVYRCSHLII